MSFLRFCAATLAVVSAAFAPLGLAQSISITTAPGAVESFDSLANTGTTNLTLPNGWYMAENGAAGNGYAADNGSLATGNTYSYGATGSAERAFGGLQSGSLVPLIGAQLTNNSGAILTQLAVDYTGEQWRLGTLARVDRLDFQYSTTATSLTSGTWTDFDLLDFTAPVTTGTAGSALDGNLAANRTAIANVISGLNVAVGATLWVRWVDLNATSNDDGLALDNVRFQLPGDFPPSVATTVPANGATGVALNSPITINFSEPVATNGNWFSVICASSGTHTATYDSPTASSRVINPNLPFSSGESCTVQVLAAQVTDLDVPLDNMAANYTFSFTAVVDVAPTVLSTVPANGATGISVNTNVVINFSEPVSTTNPWLALVCNGSPYPGVISSSNGGSTWTLDPTVDLNPGQNCTITITPANVIDNDGVAQTLAGSTVFTFSVAADVSPTVVSTYPANLDVNVPAASNLSVVFSEPVTAPDSAFTISCTQSGIHGFVSSNLAQTTYTLNPTTDFTASEDCTLDLDAAQILDIDGAPNQLASNLRVSFSIGAGLGGYYDRVDASSCTALRATLHGVIDDHTSFPYTGSPTDVWTLLEAGDQDPLNPGKILDIYRNRSMTKGTARANGTASDSDGFHYNREHTWPKSLGFPSTTGDLGLPNAPHTDGHMLHASEVGYNSTRGNNPYVNCAAQGSCSELATDAYNGQGGGTGVFHGNSNWSTSTTFEPWVGFKGPAARSILYMDVRYEGGKNTRTGQSEPDLVVTDNLSLVVLTSASPAYMGKKSDLIAWHNANPPSTQEVLRNTTIQSFQGNRNPFVDHPEWVAIAFAEPCTGPQLIAVDDDFAATEDTVLNRAAPGALSDDHQYSASPTALAAALVSPPDHGGVTLAANGSFTYTPAANYCGKDSFVYSATDNSGSDQAIVHLDVACVNDLPTAVGTLPDVTLNVGDLASIPTASGFSDADGDLLVYSFTGLVQPPSSLSINSSSGLITGTILAGDVGVYTVNVRAAEPSPLTGSVQQSFTLTINAAGPNIFKDGFE